MGSYGLLPESDERMSSLISLAKAIHLALSHFTWAGKCVITMCQAGRQQAVSVDSLIPCVFKRNLCWSLKNVSFKKFQYIIATT